MNITVAGEKKEVKDGLTVAQLVVDEKVETPEYVLQMCRRLLLPTYQSPTFLTMSVNVPSSLFMSFNIL